MEVILKAVFSLAHVVFDSKSSFVSARFIIVPPLTSCWPPHFLESFAFFFFFFGVPVTRSCIELFAVIQDHN